MRARKPPEYVIVPSALVYSDLPASIQRTGERVYGLAWECHRGGGRQQPLTATVGLEELCEICDLGRRQLFAHLRVLVNRRVLRYTYSKSAGIYVFELPPRSQWKFLRAKSAENCTVPAIDVVVDTLPQSEGIEQQQQSFPLLGGSVRGGSGECGKLHSKAGEFLDCFGILEPTRGELLGLEWVDADYLEEWWEWWQLEGDEELGPGWFVVQFRQAAEAPERRGEEMWW